MYKAAEDLVSLVEIVLLAAVSDTDFIDDIAEEAQGVAESMSLKGIAHQFVLRLGVGLASQCLDGLQVVCVLFVEVEVDDLGELYLLSI